MKVYEIYRHKSYEVDPEDIDFERTRSEGRGFKSGAFMKASNGKWHGNEIFFKTKTIYKYSVPFFVSKGTWEKVISLEKNENKD